MKLLGKLAIVFVGVCLFVWSPHVGATPIAYHLGDTTEIYGDDAEFAGTSVSFYGTQGILDPAPESFSVFELVIGTLSISTSDPLNRNLPTGFNTFDFTISVTIGGITRQITNPLTLVIDQSNDGAILLGALGVTSFDLGGFNAEFQFLTASTGAANAGETRTTDVNGQFYFRPVAVPEPGTLALFGIGLAGMGLARRRK